MALCARPMRQKMPPKMSAEDTLDAARATLVARSRLTCRLRAPGGGHVHGLQNESCAMPYS